MSTENDDHEFDASGILDADEKGKVKDVVQTILTKATELADNMTRDQAVQGLRRICGVREIHIDVPVHGSDPSDANTENGKHLVKITEALNRMRMSAVAGEVVGKNLSGECGHVCGYPYWENGAMVGLRYDYRASELTEFEATALAVLLASIRSDRATSGGRVALWWSVEDVQSVCGSLTDDEAMEVLRYVERNHDASIGVRWETFEWAIRELFPDRKLVGVDDDEDEDEDEFANMTEMEVILRMGWSEGIMNGLRKRFIDESRQDQSTFVEWIRELAREEEEEAKNDESGGT